MKSTLLRLTVIASLVVFLTMTGATEYVVKSSCTGISNCFTNFQTAINTAGTDNGKRFVTVDAGLSFTGSFTLPANTDGNWIIIRSSACVDVVQFSDNEQSSKGRMLRLDPPH